MPFILAGLVKKLLGRDAAWSWGFSCGWSGRREQGKGNRSMNIQASAGYRCAVGGEE